jgi:hypothetical protein
MDQRIVVRSERRIRDAERGERGDAKSDTAEEISAVGRLGHGASGSKRNRITLPGAPVTTGQQFIRRA